MGESAEGLARVSQAPLANEIATTDVSATHRALGKDFMADSRGLLARLPGASSGEGVEERSGLPSAALRVEGIHGQTGVPPGPQRGQVAGLDEMLSGVRAALQQRSVLQARVHKADS